MEVNNSQKNTWLSRATKPLLAIVLFAIFFAPLQGIVPVAKAQGALEDPAQLNAGGVGVGGTDSAIAGQQAGTGTDTSGPPNSIDRNGTASTNGGSGPAPAVAAPPNSPGSTVECTWHLEDWGICFTSLVYVFTVGLMSVFAYIGAFVFDTALQVSLQSVTYSQLFLSQAWAAVRDLANMAFIFLLVYLAITIVLRAETSGTTKMLAGVVVAALLINFSFFATRVVIDGGNVLALQFYNAVAANAPTLDSSSYAATGVTGAVGSTIGNTLSANGKIKDLTANLMNVIGVQSFLGNDSFNKFASILKKDPKSASTATFTLIGILIFIYIAVAVILAMLAFTFIAVGVKFIVRIVVLWLVIIASPLAFVAKAIFNKGSSDRFGLFKKWSSALIEFSFYPAVFLFIFWIINLFAVQLSSAQGGLIGASFQDAGSSAGMEKGAIYVLATVVASASIRLGIVIALLFLAMKASDRIAKTSIGVVDSLGGRAGGWVGGKFSRIGAFAGRNTVGAGAFALSQSTLGRRLGNNAFTRPLLYGAQGLSRASYDARGIKGVQSVIKEVTGVDVGKPSDRNYVKDFDARVKARKDFSETLKPNQRTLDNAFRKAIANIENPADRQELIDAADNYASMQDKRAIGEATPQDVKDAAARLKRITDSTNVIKEGKKIAGSDFNKTFATAIGSPNWRNLWGVATSGDLLRISASDREAAAQIRGNKNDAERLKSVLSRLGYTAGATPPTTSPTTPPPVTPIPPVAPAPITPPATPPTGGGAGPTTPPRAGGGTRSYDIQRNRDVMGVQLGMRAAQNLPELNSFGSAIGRRDSGTSGASSTSSKPATPSITPKDLEKLGETFVRASERAASVNKEIAQEQLALSQKTFQEQRRTTRTTQRGLSSLHEELVRQKLSPTQDEAHNDSTTGQNPATHAQHNPQAAATPTPRAIPKVVAPPPPPPPATPPGPPPADSTPPKAA